MKDYTGNYPYKLLRKAIFGMGILAAITLFVYSSPLIPQKDGNRKWADWTGFGKDTTKTVETTKRQKNGEIIKNIEKYESGKTLWDWLSVAVIPASLTIAGFLFQMQQKEQADTNLREQALSSYLDSFSNISILLDKKLAASDKADSSQQIELDLVRARTLSLMRMLEKDKVRSASVLYFLGDVDFLKHLKKLNINAPDLSNLDLNRIRLHDFDLTNANFSGATLTSACFSHSVLKGANFHRSRIDNADLKDADLRDADLKDADLRDADLTNADLRGAQLQKSCLRSAKLVDSKLLGANLNQADLQDADFTRAVLRSPLSRADLRCANLQDTDMRGADLQNADLRGAKNLTPEQIQAARNWELAYYSPEFYEQLGLSNTVGSVE